MEHNTVINTVGGAFSFAMIGFIIVMIVLAVVVLCIAAVMKLEPIFFKEKKKALALPAGELDPVVLVLITAAVAAHFKVFRIQDIRIGKRKDSVWNEIGRSSHHGSHVIK